MFPSFCRLWSTPARCGTLILLRILRNLRKCRSLLYVFVLNNGILIIRLFFLFLTSQHLPHGRSTLTSAQCSTLSTSCYTSLKKYLSLEPLLYTRQITYIYCQPLCRTNSYLNSFIPKTCSEWNSLPLSIRSSDCISSFKSSLREWLNM